MAGPRRTKWARLAIALAVLAVSGACATETDAGLDGVVTDTATDAATGAAADSAEAGEGADDTASTDGTATSQSPQSTTTAMAGDADVDLSDAAQVTVLDAGAEPRTQLRTRITPGQTETMIMVQTQEIRQEIGGQTTPGAGPIPMIIELDLRADSMGGALLTYSSDITSVAVGDGVDETLAAQLEEGLQVMIGLTTMAVVDDRGRVLTTEISGLEALDPTLASTMEQMLTSSQFAHPLPEEAVGVGARWAITQQLPVNGLDVQQVTSYEVLAIDGPVVELAADSEQVVPVGSEMMAGGASATVVAWESVSSGTIRLDLTSMVPTSTSELFAEQEFEFGPGAEKTVLKQTIETQVEITAG